METLRAALAELLKMENVIRDSGEVAPAGCWIDAYRPAGRAIAYARKRSDCKMWDGKRTKSLGRLGSESHRAFELAIKRRNALDEIAARAIALQAMLDNPVWRPEPLKLDQSRYVESSAA